MGKRGFKKKPTAIKIIEGNPGKRRLPEEPKFKSGVHRPKFLTDDARAEWDRMAPELESMGLLTIADIGAFAVYCQAWAEWKLAAEKLATETNYTTFTVRGSECKSPWVSIIDTAASRMRKHAALFGFSPADRADMGTAAMNKKESEFEKKRKAKLQGRGT